MSQVDGNPSWTLAVSARTTYALCQCPLAQPGPFKAACSWIVGGLLAQCPISSWVEQGGRELVGTGGCRCTGHGRMYRAERPAWGRRYEGWPGGGLGSGFCWRLLS